MRNCRSSLSHIRVGPTSRTGTATLLLNNNKKEEEKQKREKREEREERAQLSAKAEERKKENEEKREFDKWGKKNDGERSKGYSLYTHFSGHVK